MSTTLTACAACQVMDKHLAILARSHIETKFIKACALSQSHNTCLYCSAQRCTLRYWTQAVSHV